MESKVKCSICQCICTGREAGDHKTVTGHDDWELLYKEEGMREKMARTPVQTHKYLGKRYLTIDGVDQILALFPDEEEVRKELLSEEGARLLIESIIRRERKDERERIIKVGDKLMEMLSHADFANGVEFSGMDEGRVRGYEMMKDLEAEWQALKEGR